MTSTTTVLALDAASFPHLLDQIISSAPLGALLNLRRTSRTLMRKVNKKLEVDGCHLVLSLPETATGCSYAFRDNNSVLKANTLETIESLASYTHILDFDGNIEHQTLTHTARTLPLEALKVTRVLNFRKVTGKYPFKSPTYIVSINSFEPSDPGPFYNHFPFPHDTFKVVVNVVIDVGCWAAALNSCQSPLFPWHRPRGELVVIVSEALGPGPSQLRWPPKGSQLLAYALFRVMMAPAFSLPNTIKYTLVDLCRLKRIREDEDRALLIKSNMILDYLWAKQSQVCIDWSLSQSDKHREVDKDGYHDEVGDALFALETMAPDTMAMIHSM